MLSRKVPCWRRGGARAARHPVSPWGWLLPGPQRGPRGKMEPSTRLGVALRTWEQDCKSGAGGRVLCAWGPYEALARPAPGARLGALAAPGERAGSAPPAPRAWASWGHPRMLPYGGGVRRPIGALPRGAHYSLHYSLASSSARIWLSSVQKPTGGCGYSWNWPSSLPAMWARITSSQAPLRQEFL